MTLSTDSPSRGGLSSPLKGEGETPFLQRCRLCSSITGIDNGSENCSCTPMSRSRSIELQPSTAEGDRLWVMLDQVSHAMGRVAASEQSAPPGASLPQTRVLFILQNISGLATLIQISQRLSRTTDAVSRLLIRMEQQGLVRRVRPGSRTSLSGARFSVMLTERGREVLTEVSPRRRLVRRIMSCLSSEERQNLRTYLEKLREQAVK